MFRRGVGKKGQKIEEILKPSMGVREVGVKMVIEISCELNYHSSHLLNLKNFELTSKIQIL